MAEKTAAKKEQQKNKKPKNGINVQTGKPRVAQEQPQKQQKKKEKTKQKVQAKPSGSILGRLFKRIVKMTVLVSIAMAVLYWLDVERFRQVQLGAGRAVEAAVNLLPPQTFVLLNQTSTFLNTDPRVKVYWANLRDIAGLLRDRCADALATLAVVVPVYVNDVKRLVLDALNTTKT